MTFEDKPFNPDLGAKYTYYSTGSVRHIVDGPETKRRL